MFVLCIRQQFIQMAQATGQEPKELNTALGIKEARGSRVKIHRGTQMPPCLEWSLVSLHPRLRKTASYLPLLLC